MKKEGKGRSVFASAAMGGTIGLIFSCACLLAAAAITDRGVTPESFMVWEAGIGAAVGGFAGACFAGKRQGGKTMAAGLLAALFLVLLLLLGSVFMGSETLIGERTPLFAACILAGGAAGGLRSAGSGTKRKRR